MTAFILALVLAQVPTIEPDRYPNPYLYDCALPPLDTAVELPLDMETPAQEAREAEAAWAINALLEGTDRWVRP
jgi:hypothetical protein